MDDSKTKTPTYLRVGNVVAYAVYIWVLFGIIILGIRVFLLAFSANSSAPFVDFVYKTSASFLQPFRGIFPPKFVGTTSYLDVASLFAMIIYGLLGWGFLILTHYLHARIDAYHMAAKEAAQRQHEEAMQHEDTLPAQKQMSIDVTTRKPPPPQ